MMYCYCFPMYGTTNSENFLFSDRLVFGMLYPAYYSYKAVKTKNVKEYVSHAAFNCLIN